jgi:ribosomal protein S12 methylthiotransferase accessory factor
MPELKTEERSTSQLRLQPPADLLNFEWAEPQPFDAKRILDILPVLFSPRTGIIRSLAQTKLAATEPRLFTYFATVADLLHDPELTGWYGTAIGMTHAEAMAATLGEALERYCLFNAGANAKLIRATYPQVAEWAIDPMRFSRCSEAEYEFCRTHAINLQAPSHETVYSWTWGYSLTQRRPVLVPASQVYQGRRFDISERFTFPSSSGSALGQSLLGASLQGLYEVVERDAFTITWLNRLVAPQINLTQVAAQSADIKQIVDATAHSYIELKLNNITTDTGIPVVFCTCLNSGSRTPGLVVGASANLDPQKAICKALMEGIHCRVFFSEDFQSKAGKLTPEMVTNRDQHVLLYTQPEMVSALDFLTKAAGAQTLTDLPDHYRPGVVVPNLEKCVSQLAACNMETIVVDITADDIRELGFVAAKVLVPEAQPLNFGPTRYLSGPRLYQVPSRLGYTSGLTYESGLNPLPHPFP